MCNPMAIAGAAAMLGGAYAQHRGQEQSENAVVNVRRAEDSRQNVFKDQAEAGLKKNMQNSTEEAVTGRQNASAASREAAYRAANAAAPHATQQAAAGSLGGNKVVADNLGQMLAGVSDRVQQQGDARARLGSFGDAMFDTNLLLGRGREDIGQAGDFAAGSLRPVEMEMEAGAHRGDKAKALGTLLQIAGTAMMGGAGAGAAGGTVAAPAGASIGSGAGMMAQPFMQMLGGGSTFGAGWLAPTAGSAFGAASAFQ